MTAGGRIRRKGSSLSHSLLTTRPAERRSALQENNARREMRRASHTLCPPFEPTVVDSERLGLPASYGKLLVGRGTIDHRGPLLAAIQAFRAMQQSGDLPVNVIWAIEGEEEIGSPNLPAFVERYQDELREADGFWFPRMSREHGDTSPMVVHRGYKGQIWLNLTIKGGEWGRTLDGRDIWAANVGWVDAPLWRLIRATASLVDEDDRLAIDGIWDHVRPIGAHDREELDRLRANFDEHSVARSLKIQRFKSGRSGRDLLERYVMEPQINVGLGILPGLPDEVEYTKGLIDGTYKTELVMRARARLDIRLVPELERDLVIRFLREHLDRRGFHEIAVTPARPAASRLDHGRALLGHPGALPLRPCSAGPGRPTRLARGRRRGPQERRS
jgi:acetylornithine deacetylase/succinyl-diaminopimelate desuccinylase-like protein